MSDRPMFKLVPLPPVCYCAECKRQLVNDTDFATGWGPICEDPPAHRHLGIGSACCNSAIIDRLEDGDPARRLLHSVEALR